jgi:hypothetical protein
VELPGVNACLKDGVRERCLEQRSPRLPRYLDLHRIPVRSATYDHIGSGSPFARGRFEIRAPAGLLEGVEQPVLELPRKEMGAG